MESSSVESQLSNFVANNASSIEPSIDKELGDFVREEKYGTIPQQIATGLEGAASAATFGLSTGLETALGVPEEDIAARREENPLSYTAGQIAGVVGTSAIPGLGGIGGAGKIMTGAGEAAAAALGFAQEATTLTKIGSQAAKMAAENMLFQAGDEVSKMFTDNSPPGEAAQTALVNIGLSGLIGVGMGGAMGSISPLWKSTAGPYVESILKTIQQKADGLTGVIPEGLENALMESGIAVGPEVKAFLAGTPLTKEVGQRLEQSAAPKGLDFQNQIKILNEDTAKKAVEAFGKTTDDVNKLRNLSDYEAGKEVVAKLKDSIQGRAEPIIKEFQDIRQKFSKVPLTEEADVLADQLANLAESQYGSYRLGDDYQFIQKQLSNLPNIRDLEGLRQVQSGLWNEAKSGKASWQAVGQVVGILREVEGNALIRAAREEGEQSVLKLTKANKDLLGAAGDEGKKLLSAEKAQTTKAAIKAGEDSIMRVQLARSAYGDLAKELESLNNFVKLKGWKGPESFVEALGNTGEESILRKLTREDSVRLTEYLKKSFPEAAQEIKNYQTSSLLKEATRYAKDDEVINVKRLFNEIDSLSPELRNNLISPDVMKKLDAIRFVKESLPDKPMNTSGTAKTLAALMGNSTGTAVGMASMIMGNNPVVSFLVGALTNHISRDIPDATRMALLKYIGTGGKIEAGAFKSMVDYIGNALKGEARLSQATKNIFKSGAEVISIKMIPDQKDRDKLDKRVAALRDNPQEMLAVGGNSGAYIPNQAAGASGTATNAVNVLNSLRPFNQKNSPLDKDFPPTDAQKAKYNRALDIAEQPLMVLRDIKDGTINHEDVSLLSSMYPDLYAKLQNKVMADMNEAISKDEAIPYNTRMGLSLFLGQPLDSTMTPAAISAIQQQNMVAPANQQMQNAPKSMSGLGKMPNNYQTVDQARVARKLRN